MIAVIEMNGKQYRVQPEQVIRTLRVPGEVGERVQAERVLFTADDDKVQIGQPTLADATVELEIVRQAKSPKLHIFTYQRQKRHSRRMGYREEISYLRVKEIKA